MIPGLRSRRHSDWSIAASAVCSPHSAQPVPSSSRPTARGSPPLPPIVAVSTVGAGDSSLAGYILAEAGGGSESERLRHAVAYGSAAASLPGTTLPTPEQIDLAAVSVSAADAASPIPVPTELA